MASRIKCGHCKSSHITISAVRECSRKTSAPGATRVPPHPVRLRDAVAEILASATPEPATDGMYKLDGEIYKVQRAVHGSGHLYAKRLDTTTQTFVFATGMVRQLNSSHRLTLDEARAYGALYGVCCRCARTLTDEESISAGIGPTCAGKI